MSRNYREVEWLQDKIDKLQAENAKLLAIAKAAKRSMDYLLECQSSGDFPDLEFLITDLYEALVEVAGDKDE